MKFNGRNFEAGDPIDRGYILDVNPSKLGTLLRTRFIEEAPHVGLQGMTKDELVVHAADVGADVDKRWGIQRIIATIEESKHGS